MTRDELARRIAETAVLHGSFTLRSGRKSSFYIDKYLFLSQPRILAELGRMIAARLPDRTTRLAGAALGGIPLLAAASLASDLPCVFVRNSRKGYGTGRQLEGPIEASDHVVIVEDVATSGGQAIEAAKVVIATGAAVERIIATIDRQEGAREKIEAAGYQFESLFTVDDLGIKT